MVDIGGGHGAVSLALARATKHLEFIVQDLPKTTTQGQALRPHDLAGRVQFQAHDFFEEQIVKDADVYFLRYILHNWSDKHAARILKAIVPALKDGSKIICVEFLPEDQATAKWSDKQPLSVFTLLTPLNLLVFGSES